MRTGEILRPSLVVDRVFRLSPSYETVTAISPGPDVTMKLATRLFLTSENGGIPTISDMQGT